MPTHPKIAGGSNALRHQLLAMGAEQMYRKLQRDLAALRRAYPALSKFDQVNPSNNGHQADPAPEALRLFKERMKAKPTRKKADLTPPRKNRRRKISPVKPGTLTAHMIQVLKDQGPLTAAAVANAVYETGTWKPHSNTEKHRISTISVMLRQLAISDRKLVKIAGGKGTSTNPRVYAAY